jgi:biopolymer transport protein ExbD
LITAVWIQMAAIPAAHGRGDGDGAEPSPLQLTLRVQPSGFLLEQSDGERVTIDGPAGQQELVQLATLMQNLKHAHPTKQDIAVVAADDVNYQRLVQTMDILRAAEFPAIHVRGHSDPR